MQKIITVQNLSYQYPQNNHENNGDALALNNVSFEIAKGEFVGIIGHNGSGKSTLAKLLNGIILPTKGDVMIAGMNTKEPDLIWDIRKTAGMVFQNPDSQLVATMVEEDVAFGPENLGVPREEIRIRVDEALATVRMGEYKNKKPHQLSGGQKQRIAIAGVLAMQPSCIIFDEPTAMLDPVGRFEVMSTIQKLNKEDGLTVVHITHYMEELIEADRIIVLNGGKIEMMGTPKEIFSRVDDLKALCLDVPQVTALGSVLKKAGLDLPDGILSGDAFCEACVGVQDDSESKCRRAGTQALLEPESGSVGAQELLEPESRKAGEAEILSIENLSYTYNVGSPFEHIALKNISAVIPKGSFVGLIGHTGSGKSTLIQHLNALYTPTSGTVRLNGMDIFAGKKKDRIAVRHQVGLVFQYPEYQLFEETVAKDVAFGPKQMGLSEDEIARRVDWALQAVGLNDDTIKDQSPFDLSGGQMRRVAIAGVLAMRPEVLILDEPTAGLDPYGRREILGMIADLHRDEGITVVLVSHSMEDISSLADRIMVMSDGELVLYDKPSKIFEYADTLSDIGLGVPQITEVLTKLKSKGYNVDTTMFTIEAAAETILSAMGGAHV